MATKQKPVNKPIQEVRIGNIKAAIWQNQTDNGLRFNVTFQRIYRDDQGKWQSTDSFSRDDLLVLARVAERTFDAIHEMQQDREPK
jgi:hypothetical protein